MRHEAISPQELGDIPQGRAVPDVSLSSRPSTKSDNITETIARIASEARRLLTRLFYALVDHGSEAKIPVDARDFRMMDRRVVDALYALPERHRFMKGLYAWVGFRSIAIPIHLDQRRTGTSKFGMRNLFRLGLNGVTSFTAWPLRIWTSIGMAIATCSIPLRVVDFCPNPDDRD